MKRDSLDNWTEVAKTADLPPGEVIEVVVGDTIIALARVDEAFYAIDGMCAHQGGPIAQGEVAGGCVTCPWHGWQYELETGIQTINRQPLQRTFPVREIDGRIEVQL